ncbi:RMD1 family protein [Singulisphaera acidiphila]|uniref:DUF155 domain-containing protein n=1 Tax=Singulisphaera acidiphila (strain ATCC BAA-1392 / DSM 18658 / VKM B-2454 / MOB10) TaxID=886293 RepID=L0D7T1_SINAD|nr:hypothetical protein [Singulisphaera acidiphila]AGA25459.1 hypothetical protein Sinac_1060 [Singulisphaera acidiphila DSM 18658]
MELLDVTIHLAVAFDIGYEIDLEAARALLPGESGPLARRRRTPESIRYRPAPLRVAIDPGGIVLPGGRTTLHPPRAELSVFDFGALSLTVQFPIRMSPEEILTLAGELADPAPLNEAARRVVTPLIDRLRPAITGLEVSELCEEYIVFQIDNAPIDWVADHADWIARLVRLEPDPLSTGEVAEANRLSISYTPTDLVTLDWAAGFVADRDCADTLQVIEFANVQLLEFRHIDDRLDDRLEAAYKLIGTGQRERWAPPSWRMHGAAMRNVRELEIEATSLFERADNALKLIGDQYLSRVFDLASTRFHLRGWQESIRRKLDTVGDVYDLLVQQSGVIRMETLEIIVILLIAMEIVLAVYRH